MFGRKDRQLAFQKVEKWSRSDEEFVKRAAFALLGCLALHNKDCDDELFERCLPLAERAANDERNFMKKGVSWGLRGLGRRSPFLRAKAVSLVRRLADSTEPAARWIGKDVLRDLTKQKKR